ncbi:hypothetical protein A2165_01860 [Candidatus Curtissbacteria bacterium RBG_13_40_7]|uniref:Bacterial Ig-like domain-containing protein n=1 Tax=Candidatus Curtissbacteria bacterium RBG_13_40_7 TaxID=1797706 RepID=A0A1F5FWX8_9BACT|nr:MAG: hypothetical protein A2165_01860 [Candidatus Curtissbacteria bacterium RBG_13_40_7]
MAACLLLNARRAVFSILVVVSLTLFVLFFSLRLVLAGSGLVSSIGGATFIQGATHFWVTSARPTFSGIITAGAAVSGTVGSQAVSATADASGNWSWTPVADLAGDNTVALTSGSSTASFTLTIGALPDSIATSSAGSLSPAGSIFPTVAILGLGIFATTFGLWGLKRRF